MNLSRTIDKDDIKELDQKEISMKITELTVSFMSNIETLEQLAIYIPNVKRLSIYNFICNKWLTNTLLSHWNLYKLSLDCIITERMHTIAPYLQNLTSFDLITSDLHRPNDTTVVAILQACPKLTELNLYCGKYTYKTLLYISDSVILFEKLFIPNIPSIPSIDIAMHCSHALSCIQKLECKIFHTFEEAEFCIPFLTNLNTLELNFNIDSALLPLLIQHCHNIQHLRVSSLNISIQDILALLHRNLDLKEFSINLVNSNLGLTDTILIKLIHACPHLHTLYLPHETDITNIGILALSEHCPQVIICQ